MRFDLIIVGQGLAGSVLACEAQSRGLSVGIIDNGWKLSASMVAAGMWNPVSFRKIISVWRDQECMEALQTKYPAWEKSLESQFYFDRPVMRVFPNQEYADLWAKRLSEGMPWIQAVHELPDRVKAPYGAGLVDQAGYLHLPRFLQSVRDLASAESRLLEEEFDPKYLETDAGRRTPDKPVVYKHWQADHLIIAMGTSARKLSWYQGLPLQTNKGEVLDVSVKDFQRDITANNGKWLLPYNEEGYKLGASYDWRTDDLETSDEVREMLLEKVQLMLDAEVSVVEHKVGLRPTVKDRRPLLGELETRIWSFNGLGTRGVLISPLLAGELLNHIFDGAPLHPETDLNRFK